MVVGYSGGQSQNARVGSPSARIVSVVGLVSVWRYSYAAQAASAMVSPVASIGNAPIYEWSNPLIIFMARFGSYLRHFLVGKGFSSRG